MMQRFHLGRHHQGCDFSYDWWGGVYCFWS